MSYLAVSLHGEKLKRALRNGDYQVATEHVAKLDPKCGKWLSGQYAKLEKDFSSKKLDKTDFEEACSLLADKILQFLHAIEKINDHLILAIEKELIMRPKKNSRSASVKNAKGMILTFYFLRDKTDKLGDTLKKLEGYQQSPSRNQATLGDSLFDLLEELEDLKHMFDRCGYGDSPLARLTRLCLRQCENIQTRLAESYLGKAMSGIEMPETKSCLKNLLIQLERKKETTERFSDN